MIRAEALIICSERRRYAASFYVPCKTENPGTADLPVAPRFHLEIMC